MIHRTMHMLLILTRQFSIFNLSNNYLLPCCQNYCLSWLFWRRFRNYCLLLLWYRIWYEYLSHQYKLIVSFDLIISIHRTIWICNEWSCSISREESWRECNFCLKHKLELSDLNIHCPSLTIYFPLRLEARKSKFLRASCIESL